MLLLAVFGSQLNAEIRLTCKDYRGLPVKIVNLPSFPDYANARFSRDGEPLMLVNMDAINEWPEVIKAFTFYHECGHHQLGHMQHVLAPARIRQKLELQADCFSIRAMSDRLSLTEGDISHVHAFVATLAQNDEFHPDGELRARTVKQCLNAQH